MENLKDANALNLNKLATIKLARYDVGMKHFPVQHVCMKRNDSSGVWVRIADVRKMLRGLRKA